MTFVSALQSESVNFIEKSDKNVESTLISLIDEEEGISKRGGGAKVEKSINVEERINVDRVQKLNQ